MTGTIAGRATLPPLSADVHRALAGERDLHKMMAAERPTPGLHLAYCSCGRTFTGTQPGDAIARWQAHAAWWRVDHAGAGEPGTAVPPPLYGNDPQ